MQLDHAVVVDENHYPGERGWVKTWAATDP